MAAVALMVPLVLLAVRVALPVPLVPLLVLVVALGLVVAPVVLAVVAPVEAMEPLVLLAVPVVPLLVLPMLVAAPVEDLRAVLPLQASARVAVKLRAAGRVAGNSIQWPGSSCASWMASRSGRS